MLTATACPLRDPFHSAAIRASQAVATMDRDCAIAVVAAHSLDKIGADWCVRLVDQAVARFHRVCARLAAEDARTLRIPPSPAVAERRNRWEHAHRVPGRIPPLW